MTHPADAITPACSPPPWLVADIGGTHARLGMVEAAGRSVTHIACLRTADHPHLIDALRSYLAALPPSLGRPTQACLAVAAPIEGDEVRLSNHPWVFSRQAVQRQLGLERLRLLNDFEALALALPHLSAASLRTHDLTARPQPAGSTRRTLAVLGPGTGLGVAGLVWTDSGWQALPSEGGHVTLAACDDFEAAVLAAARREHAHVSAERLLSGTGLPLLHRSVALACGRRVDPALPAEAIVRLGTAPRDGDTDCAQTLAVFCAMLGTVAGNVALTLGARGGVYIGGGIVPRMADLFFASAFRERFESKGRYRGYLGAIPTALIVDPHPALAGAAVALAPASITLVAP